MVPKIITPNSITVILDGVQYMASKSHPNFEQIRAAVAKEQWQGLEELFDISRSIETKSDGTFKVVNGQLYVDGEKVHGVIEKRCLAFLEEGQDIKHLVNFWKRLQKNPSARSIETLYNFLEHENIPIGKDGFFYAYKNVRPNWYDWHSGKCFNGIGTTLEMQRSKVDDDPQRGCSYGYHVGSLRYASSFGGANGRMLICKVDPADVVSVPYDCQNQKVRTAKYVVTSEYTGALPSSFYNGVDDVNVSSPADPVEVRIRQLEDQYAKLEEQLDRYETALEAAEDAGLVGETVTNIKHAIRDTSLEMDGLIEEIEELEIRSVGEHT